MASKQLQCPQECNELSALLNDISREAEGLLKNGNPNENVKNKLTMILNDVQKLKVSVDKYLKKIKTEAQTHPNPQSKSVSKTQLEKSCNDLKIRFEKIAGDLQLEKFKDYQQVTITDTFSKAKKNVSNLIAELKQDIMFQTGNSDEIDRNITRVQESMQEIESNYTTTTGFIKKSFDKSSIEKHVNTFKKDVETKMKSLETLKPPHLWLSQINVVERFNNIKTFAETINARIGTLNTSDNSESPSLKMLTQKMSKFEKDLKIGYDNAIKRCSGSQCDHSSEKCEIQLLLKQKEDNITQLDNDLKRINMQKKEKIKSHMISLYEDIKKYENHLRENIKGTSGTICDDNDLKERCTFFIKSLDSDIEGLQDIYDTELGRLETCDVEFYDEIIVSFEDKIKIVQDKMKQISDNFDELMQTVSNSFQNELQKFKEEFENFERDSLTKINLLCSSWIDEKEIEEVKTKVVNFRKDYEKRLEKMLKTDKKHCSFNCLKLKHLNENKCKLQKQQEEIDDVINSYNKSAGNILAQSLITNACGSNSKFESINGLTVFKVPIKESHKNDAKQIRSYVIGKSRSDKDHHTCLLVGMSGAGKSLLINNMINYIYGVNHSDTFRLELIVESEEIGEKKAVSSSSEADSMTSWVSSYTFHWQEGFRIPYSFTIIDTPGFNDTRGIKYDAAIVSQIEEFFSDSKCCPGTLSSIGCLIQASKARITEEQKHFFDVVFDLFGKYSKNNVSMIFTFADPQPPPAIKSVESAKIQFKDYFKFNNSALYAPKTDTYSKMSWDLNNSHFEKYFEALTTKRPVSVALTLKQVSDSKQKMHREIANLASKISLEMENVSLIKSQYETIEHFTRRVNRPTNQDIKSSKTMIKTISFKTNSSHHLVTNCKLCNYTCLDPCNERDSHENELCTVCPKQCPLNQHINEKQVYTPIRERVSVEQFILQNHIDDNENDLAKSVIIFLYEKYMIHKNKVLNYIRQANNCCLSLDDISKTPSDMNMNCSRFFIQLESLNSRHNSFYYLMIIAERLISEPNYDISKFAISNCEEEMQEYLKDIGYFTHSR